MGDELNVYRIEMRMSATLYVRAKSEKEAREIAKRSSLSVMRLTPGEVEVSDSPFDSPELPDVSFSPVATVQGPYEEFDPDLVHKGD